RCSSTASPCAPAPAWTTPKCAWPPTRSANTTAASTSPPGRTDRRPPPHPPAHPAASSAAPHRGPAPHPGAATQGEPMTAATRPAAHQRRAGTADQAGPAPLAGYTVGVTAARRAEELAAMLGRKGADVVCAPALRIVPLSDDQALAAASRDLIAHPADIVVATTGIGFRGWLEACETWGLAEDLTRAMRTARLLARGPKAKGAIRAAGLTEEWSPPSESSAEVLDHLLRDGVEGQRIAVQLHGEPLPD